MTLIDDFKDFHKFWSVRLGALAVVLELVEFFVPILPLPRWLSVVLMVSAIVARGIAQPKLRE